MLTLKPGDIVRVRGTGHAIGSIREYTINRVTQTLAVANNGTRFKLADGMQLPRGRFYNYYIFEINGEAVVKEF